MDRATLVASLTSPPLPADLEILAPQADVIEVRADLVGHLEAARLRSHFPGRLLYTLRSTAEGGMSAEPAGERHSLLARAAADYDLVDLEAERDLDPQLLAAIPTARRVISWHGRYARSWELEQRLERMATVAARYYKLVPEASTAMEAMEPLVLLRRQGRADVVAFAAGQAAVWSRLLAPRLGSPLVFGWAGEGASEGRPAAAGQLSIAALVGDYGFPEVRAASQLNGVVGAPVGQSLSPRLHNGLYGALGIDALYVPFHVDEFGPFWLEFVERDLAAAVGFPLRGLSVTSPHKQIALAVAGVSSPLAERIGAANTLVRRRGVWEAEATDAEGVVLPLLAHGVELRGRKAAIVGVGGAGLSAAVGLTSAGAGVELFNRTPERAERAGRRLGLRYSSSVGLDTSQFDIVVNATPLGRLDDEPIPFDVEALRPEAVVVDMVYRRGAPTVLASAASRRGLTVVDGREILLYQAGLQFQMMTGQRFPLDLARDLLDSSR